MVAIAGLVRDENLGVYVLANRDHVEVRHALMYRVLDHFLAPDDVRDWSAELKPIFDAAAQASAEARVERENSRVEGTSPSLDLKAYVGTYSNQMYGDVEVTLRDAGLYVSRSPDFQGPATHWHYDTFRVAWEARWGRTALSSFELSSDGAVSALDLIGIRWARQEEN